MSLNLDLFMSFPCPGCGIENEVTLGSIVHGGTIVCRGCLETVSLVDNGGGLDRALKDMRNFMGSWGVES